MTGLDELNMVLVFEFDPREEDFWWIHFKYVGDLGAFRLKLEAVTRLSRGYVRSPDNTGSAGLGERLKQTHDRVDAGRL